MSACDLGHGARIVLSAGQSYFAIGGYLKFRPSHICPGGLGGGGSGSAGPSLSGGEGGTSSVDLLGGHYLGDGGGSGSDCSPASEHWAWGVEADLLSSNDCANAIPS